MKSHEQFGYNSEDFSNALTRYNNPEETARLRKASVAVTNPFTAPEYIAQSRRPQAERYYEKPYDDGPEDEDTPDLSTDSVAQNDLPTMEVHWTILPADEGEARGFGGDNGDSSVSVEDKPENIRRLEAFGLQWGNGSYKAISRIEASDGTLYEIVVLPIAMGGIALEYALADTSEGGNSILAWRAERGVKDNGEAEITWRDVFSDTKNRAVEMGARRIYHTPTTYDRVERYFAWPANRLDEPFSK